MMKATSHSEKNGAARVVLRMAIVGIFGALAFVCTAFLAIPYPGGGYFNFGDAITLLIALLFGPIEGALVGMLSGGFADLFAGYGSFIPFTIVAKALLGLASGFLYRFLKNKKLGLFLGTGSGAILQIIVYFFAYLIIEGQAAWLSSGFDCIQSFGCAIIAISLFIPLKKTGVAERL